MEYRTKDPACIFERFFNQSSDKSSTHTLEKYLEKTFAVFCSVFESLRLESIKLVVVW